MSVSVNSVRRFMGWSLLGTVSLLVVLLVWNLLGLSQNLDRIADETSARTLAIGEELRAEMAPRNYQEPSEAAMPLLRPDRDPEGALYPRQLSVKLGGGILWAVPPYAPPKTTEPPSGESRAEATAETRWTYTYRIPDGRLFLVTFEAPAYARARSRTTLLAIFEVAGAAILILFWVLLALRLYTSYREVLATARQADDLLPRSEGGNSTQDVVAVFQRMVVELKARTAELERLSTAQKRKAEDVESMAEALCANLAAGYLRFDADGKLAGTNADARRLLGLVTVPMLGETGERTLADFPDVQGLLEEARESRAVAARDELPGAGGLLLQAVAIPLFNQMNHSLGELLVVRDLTDFYRMGRTLREREALVRLGEVAAGVAHEVRNGLNVLTLQLKNLEADHGDLTGDPRLGAARAEIGQLGQVVNELLFFAKPLKVEKVPVTALGVLEATAERLRALFPGLTAQVSAPKGLEVGCDPESLGRALLNLGRNAAESATAAHPGAGRVYFAARPHGSGVELRVEDDGPGLTPEARASLFAPFASGKPGGTGLGLPIARKIAREHGGDLDAAAPEHLTGAAFVLTLPA